MTRALILFICLLYNGFADAQESAYQASLRTYRELKTDSALWYIVQAAGQFRDKGQHDSLVYAYVHKADILWAAKGIPAGLATIDTATALAAGLPFHDMARVAALNKKGQIHVHNTEAEKGKKYLLQALEHVGRGAPPNGILAALYTNLSWLYLDRQDFKPALRYAGEARRINEELYGKDARQLLGAYQSLCLIAHDAGWFEQSEAYGLELYRLAKLHLPPHHPNLGLVHNDLGTLYESLHRFDEALFHRQQMLNIIQQDYLKHKNPQLLAIAYNNMGNLYGSMGEHYLSHEYFEKARQLHEINYGDDSPGIVRPLTHLANAKRYIGQLEEAGQLYLRAYELQQKHAPDDRLNLAYVETQYGDLFYDRKNYPEAARLYHHALVNQQKAGLSNTGIAVTTKTTLGETYARMSRTREALELLGQGLAAHRRDYKAGHIIIAGQLNKISEAYLLAGNAEQALRYSDSTFAELLMTTQLPEGNWLLRLPYQHHMLRYLRQRVAILSELFTLSGDNRYLHQLLRLTEQYSQYLVKGLPALRTQSSLIQLAADHKSIYNAAIEACWRLYEAGLKGDYLEKAFEYTERSKAMLLRLAANNIVVDAGRISGSNEEDRDRYWRQHISGLNARYLNTDRQNDSLLVQLSAAMEAYKAYQDSLLRAGNPEWEARYRLQPFTLQETREQLLGKGQTLLQYAVTDQAVFVFVLTEKVFKAYRLPRQLLEDIQPLQQLYSLSADQFMIHARRLYQNLIAPVADDLLSDKLFIIPDAELYYLNFELLVASDAGKSFRDMDYLLRRYNVSYLLSAASAIQFRAAQSNHRDKALLLAPVFTDAMKASYHSGIRDTLQADADYSMLLRQPFALHAAQEIGKFLRSDLLAEEQAQESRFKSSAGNYRVLHLGTHAEINNHAPLQSRFFLAKPAAADTADLEDGYLHAYEIYAMQLRAELAVLTACETGGGSWNQGEGVISLAHSFMYAGCPSVVMSLWKIDEKTSSAMIARFYRFLADGFSKSESLRKAKLEYLGTADGELTHPYYWAGMALIGSDDPVYVSTPRWRWYTVAALLLSALVIGWFRRSERFRQRKV